jgi:formate-dependent nitrite reductase cytochrome c552 subunit
MSENTLAANEVATDTTANESSQAQAARTYTQEEFDNHMAGLKSSLAKKLLKPYEELGDVEELRQLKLQAQQKAQEEQLKRGEFESILQELAAKKDSEIQKRDREIEKFKVEQPLLQAASEFRSVNPGQVQKLLRQSVRLNAEGEVEVLDEKGSVRYNDKGQALQVKDLVKEFLTTNPHFVQPTPSTTNSSHSVKTDNTKMDITKLDMKDPNDRKIYAEWRKENGIR